MKTGLGMIVLGLLVMAALQSLVFAETLSIVHVDARTLNCKFDSSCKVPVTDAITDFAWGGASNDSFLQSRAWPAGQPGTVAAGLYAYIYQIDLSKAPSAAERSCVSSFSIFFGSIEAIDYSGNGSKSQVFVITSGGPGSIAPVTAVKSGNKIDFRFEQPFCNGGATFFFGMSSKNGQRTMTATLTRDIGPALNLQAIVPKLPAMRKGTKQEVNRPIRVRDY